MKLCDVVQFHSPLSGGVKRYIGDKIRFFAQAADGLEHEHMVVVPSHRDAVGIVGRSRVYEVRSPRLLGSKSYRMLVSARRLGAIIDRERPDLIEVGDPYRAAWIAVREARRLNIPIVAFYHSDYPRALGRTIRRFAGRVPEAALMRVINGYLRSLYANMDATIVATARVERMLTRLGIRRLVRIPLGVDPDAFRPSRDRARLRRALGVGPDRTLLIYVGRLAREKNIDALVEMMDLLPADRFSLLVMGDGEKRRVVRGAARRRANIMWRPYSEHPARLSSVYTAGDLFVHPSITETFGLVSLEAQACGTRVIPVRNGGAEDTLRGEMPRIVAAAPTAVALAEAVRRGAALHETAHERRLRRERIVRHFASDACCRGLMALSRELHEQREGAMQAAARAVCAVRAPRVSDAPVPVGV
jgi:alpha-1,6-mannosyltransferase